MSESESEAVTRPVAEVYEEFFVPAILQAWANRVAETAGIQTGQSVLDVACGTGILARTVAERVGPKGAVIGIDPSEGMLTVARRKAPAIEWRDGRAEALPFEANRFDAVVSQFGLMFFEDRRLAIQEMWRALRPGGHLAVAVWDSLENTPGDFAVVNLLERLYGQGVAEGWRLAHALGDAEILSALFTAAGVARAEIMGQEGVARFPSLRAWLLIEVKAWLLGDRMDEIQFEEFLREAAERLRPFGASDGAVALPAPAYIVTATK
ncbi:MAG: methyltransferase domain-containing protein [Anaerolineae bacterium]|nr:methyltransferase domain-containing protein [Anaerolineae bacterium]